MDNILRIRLDEDGNIIDYIQDFIITRGSYGSITLQVEVPHCLLLNPVLDIDGNTNSTGNNVRVGAIIRTATGHNKKTKAYEFKRIKDFKINNVDYRLYQRPMPKVFTLWETVSNLEEATPGLLEMVFNIVNWTLDAFGAKVETNKASHIIETDVHPSTNLEEGEEIEIPSDLEILQSQVQELDAEIENVDARLGETTEKINAFSKLAKLKINVNDMPNDIIFSESGYKSPFCEFYPVNYTIATIDGSLSNKNCSVVATHIVPDSTSPDVVGYQTEFAYAEDGIYVRTNKYNISQSSIGIYTLLTAGTWEILNQDKLKELSGLIDKNTDDLTDLNKNLTTEVSRLDTKVDNNAKEIQSKLDSEITTVENKITTEVGTVDKKVDSETARLDTKIESEIARIEQKVNMGVNYVGQYPSATTLPTESQLNNFVLKNTGRATQRGDEVSFVLQVKDGLDIPYNIRYSDITNTWNPVPLPSGGLADNINEGYIVGSNTSYNETSLIKGIVKMLVDIQGGQINDILVYNENIQKIVSLAASAVMYDEDFRVLISELYGKDASSEFSFIKLNDDTIEIGSTAKITLLQGKQRKFYYTWIENGELKSDTLTLDADIGDYSLLEGKALIDYCVSLFNSITENKKSADTKFEQIDSSIAGLNNSLNATNKAIEDETQRATEALSAESKRLDQAIADEKTRSDAALATEVTRLDNAITAEQTRASNALTTETQRLDQAILNEKTRATNAETQLSTNKLDKANINENYLKDIVFTLNGDTGVATATFKNPVTGKDQSIELTVVNSASTSSTGLMTKEMVTALNKAVKDIESLKYIGRQIKIFDTYADAQSFDWSTTALNLNDYFVVVADESRELEDEKGKTSKYTCISIDSPITTESSFVYSGAITTIVIQVATESEVGGVISTNANGYIFVESNGAMKLVGYDAIITSINNLNQSLTNEIARAKAAESQNASAISTETARAKSAEGVNAKAITDEVSRAKSAEGALEENKVDKTTFEEYKTSIADTFEEVNAEIELKANTKDLPTNVSHFNNDANYAKTSQLPTKTSQLQNDGDGTSVFARQSDLPTKLSQFTDDIGVSDKAEQSALNTLSNTVDQIIAKNTSQDSQITKALTDAKQYTDEKIEEIVGTSPDNLNTIYELAEAIENNEDVVSSINDAISKKASQTDLNTTNTNVSNLTTRVGNVESKNTTQDTNISNNASAISALQTRATNIENKNTSQDTEIAKKIPQGGTLTAPLTVTGGDGATAGKIILTENGQITDASTATLLGRSSGNFIVGHSSYPTTIRGKATRPTYNGNDLALKSDVPTNNSTLTNGAGYDTVTRVNTLDAQNVKLTGNQSIAGTKNFTGTFQIGGATISYSNGTFTI